MLKKLALAIGILSLLIVGGFILWASTVNPIMPAARYALVGDALVETAEDGGWLVFRPAGQTPETGLVFYPGGRVDYRAYAPYARAVAAQGYLVVIVRMPLNLAVFNAYAAEDVLEAYPAVKHWAVGGHSLGGSMAASFAARYSPAVEGLVLLAAYPANSDNLASSDLKVISISAGNDGLATAEKIDASRALLPEDIDFVQIKGGNHAQFGDYGVQGNDGAAEISREAQQSQAVAATVALLNELAGK